MRRSLLVLAVYVVLSSTVFLVWSVAAKTELLDEDDESLSWSSITEMIDGGTPAPFIRRRLLPDLAVALARATPPSAWSAITKAIEGDSWPQRKFRSFLNETLAWRRENYPELFSAYFLIWASTLGFMFACRSFAMTQYDGPPEISAAVGALLGVGLLGGYGVWNEYPYDIPNAFLFVLTLTGIVAGRWWVPLAFVAATYSKETAVFLIAAYALTMRAERRKLVHLMTLLGMITVFGGIQFWIASRFTNPPPPQGFWFPARNAIVLAKGAIEHMWEASILGVVIIRMAIIRSEIPRDLRRLLLLVPVMLTLAFFKGWIEERRQYYEVYPIVGLVVFQWAALELGAGRFFRPRISTSSIVTSNALD